MHAIVHDRYGPPDVLRLDEVPTPSIGDHDVLLRVRAAAVNPLDWHTVRGLPYPLRLGNGFARPTRRLLGMDVAGEVEATGRQVATLRAGDEVFGVCSGAFAEYACARADRLAPKPATLTFQHAAAVPVAGLTALQGLRDHGRIQPGQQVLVVGASGGVGTFAVQLAKAYGAQVTGVCSGTNVDLVRSLGADRIIDYTREDFSERPERHDLILDMAGTQSLAACRRALAPRGRYVLVGAPSGRWFKGLDRFVKALIVSRFGRQRLVPFIASPSQADLLTLKGLIETGRITPIIDRVYGLADVPAALAYLETGRARGKVVVSVDR